MTVDKIVENNHLLALDAQALDGRASDKARPACHENCHRAPVSNFVPPLPMIAGEFNPAMAVPAHWCRKCGRQHRTDPARSKIQSEIMTTIAPIPAGAAIRLQQVTRHYQMGEMLVRAADNVTLSIAAGEFVALLGS